MLKALAAISALMLFGFPNLQPVQTAAPAQTATPTTIPVEAAKMTIPSPPTADALAKAKKMYGYDCSVCHGDAGNGKGELAKDKNMQTKDFTNPSVQSAMTDGEMFWVIQNGIGKMPGEGDRLKTDDLWAMVVYIRSFEKK